MTVAIVDQETAQSWGKKKHPEVDDQTIDEWQSIIDLMQKIMAVPAGLIMRLVDDKLSVFIRSENEGNPYKVGDSEVWVGSGLYCETVLRTGSRLFIPNALDDEEWKGNPDVKLNMISYLGLPIYWPDGDPFGTICVLDNKTRYYKDEQEELIVRLRNIIETHLAMVERNYQLKLLAEELKILTRFDGLTNALNRRTFFKESEQELRRAKRYAHPTSILMIDIDHFKMINDHYGHQVGDEALKAFSTTLAEAKRSEDIFGRIGGEEFAVLLPETDRVGALQIAERLREQVSVLSVPADGKNFSFTVSIGVSECVDSNRELQQLLNEADHALYEAKELGRNRVCLYSP